jgi:hypothetical protein
MRGERLPDQVDRFPIALLVAHRVGVGRRHLGAARFDKADLEPAARNDVGRGVFLGDAHRVFAQRHKRAEREDARLSGLPRQDADQHRVGTQQRIDPRMVLDRQHVEAEIVAQQELVDDLLEQIGGDARVAIAVGQAAAHRLRGVEHRSRDEWVGNLALPPRIHVPRLRLVRPAIIM